MAELIETSDQYKPDAEGWAQRWTCLLYTSDAADE